MKIFINWPKNVLGKPVYILINKLILKTRRTSSFMSSTGKSKTYHAIVYETKMILIKSASNVLGDDTC